MILARDARPERPAVALADRYLRQFPQLSVSTLKSYRVAIRGFEDLGGNLDAAPVTLETLERWVKRRARAVALDRVVVEAGIICRFLDWLCVKGRLSSNPLRLTAEEQGGLPIAAVARCLAAEHPAAELLRLRRSPAFGSHLGSLMRSHVERMRAAGYRFRHAAAFRCFDRFLQSRAGTREAPFTAVAREYIAEGRTAGARLERTKVVRAVSKLLRRQDPAARPFPLDRCLASAARREWRRPHIYSKDEVARWIEAARSLPSRGLPLRSLTLSTMLTLAYCTGLRIGELVRLRLGDLSLADGWIDVVDTKFFKSRRLPLSPGAPAAVRRYVAARGGHQGAMGREASLFLSEVTGRGYGTDRVRQLLLAAARRAGLRSEGDTRGPRIHDLRHTFAVHRLTQWYREGADAQARLPYLAAYMGHRDIRSTRTYLTVTRELRELACRRFWAYRTSSATHGNQ